MSLKMLFNKQLIIDSTEWFQIIQGPVKNILEEKKTCSDRHKANKIGGKISWKNTLKRVWFVRTKRKSPAGLVNNFVKFICCLAAVTGYLQLSE